MTGTHTETKAHKMITVHIIMPPMLSPFTEAQSINSADASVLVQISTELSQTIAHTQAVTIMLHRQASVAN